MSPKSTLQPKELVKTKFQEDLDRLATMEEKLHFAIEVMRLSLSQEKKPDFKQFWETKNACIHLFKERLNPIVREKLWKEYSELIREENKLQKLIEEESSFLIEQIKLAFSAIENELTFYDQQLTKVNDIQISKYCPSIAKKSSFYNDIQRELTLLNSFAARINSLKKEIEKANIRYKYKNELFLRLSSLGDKIFPKRKELIKKISAEFEKDVKEFSDKILKASAPIRIPFFSLREEIKELQYLAKLFTLNTQTFNFVRQVLSECWEKIKIEEKEIKKQKQEKLEKEKTIESTQKIEKKEIKKPPKLEWEKIKKEIYDVTQEIEKYTQEDCEKKIEELQKILLPIEIEEEIKIGIIAPMLDIVEEKKEFPLLQQNDALSQIFNDKITRRDRIKQRMERYKKLASASGLNFEKAIIYKDLLLIEKNSLEKIDDILVSIEEKINSL